MTTTDTTGRHTISLYVADLAIEKPVEDLPKPAE